jgi:YhcH/YjgK/YiaL family protein
LNGAEGIELCLEELLQSMNDYSEEKDTEHFAIRDEIYQRVDNVTGTFTILMPGEVHMPQLAVDGFDSVCKVVIKIPGVRVR